MKEKATNKVVWSRFTSVGQTTLLEALRVFSPTSTDLPSNEKDLVTYIKQLRDEGHKPTVLKSKDVYRYRSCTSVLRPVAAVAKLNSALDIASQKVKKPGKGRSKKALSKKTLEKKTEINYSLLSPAAKVVLKNQPTILLTHMSKESINKIVFSKPQAFATAPSQMSTCITLTNISGPSQGHTARLQFHTGVWPGGVPVSNSHHPPSANGFTTEALRRVNSVVCSSNLDTALIGVPLPGVLQNGRILRESNGMPCWRDQKRKWVEETEDKRVVKRPRNGVWLVKAKEDPNVSRNNFLRFKVIKIDDSITDEEVRRKAQKILRVNLSPVIEIQPLIAYPM